MKAIVGVFAIVVARDVILKTLAIFKEASVERSNSFIHVAYAEAGIPLLGPKKASPRVSVVPNAQTGTGNYM